MAEILICWIGATDLRASSELDDVGLGPVAQAATVKSYDEIVLINNYEEDRTTPYIKWLNEKTPTKISIHQESLSSPTNFGEIYQVASRVIAAKIKEYDTSANLTFHLSPGTPAMAAVWIILAKTRYPAELIESSREQGVRTASVPFDISADFIPDLLRKPDQELERLAAGLAAEAPEFEDIIHRSEEMRRVILKSRLIAPRSIPVMIEGESGTGKELLARAIHEASTRKDKPFVAINCGAIPSELVESELFGHKKGAFTGATSDRTGYFEAATGGTLFLDEIGELPKAVQVKLLRALQEREIIPVGAAKTIKIDVRVISATNRNLIEGITAGTFREDLFYRLAVAVIKLPPLRERAGDISLLIDRLLEQINRESSSEPGYKHKNISANAKNLMIQYSWPGNIRELQNTLTRAAVWSSGSTIRVKDISDALLPIPNGAEDNKIMNRPVDKGINLQEIVDSVIKHYLERGLELTHGNKTKTAKILGLPSYQTLTNWLKKYGLE